MIGRAAVFCLVIGWAIYLLNRVPLLLGRGGRQGRTSDRFQGLIALEWTGLLVAVLAIAPQTKMRHLAILVLLMILVAQFLVVKRGTNSRLPLFVATLVCMLAMVLPLQTDSETFIMGARETWRANGGVIITILGLYFVALWSGCAWVKNAHESRR